MFGAPLYVLEPHNKLEIEMAISDDWEDVLLLLDMVRALLRW